jgi:hypothetical protein
MLKSFNLKSEVLKNIIVLTSGTFFAQLVAYVLTPVITRLYTPDESAELGLFLRIIGVVHFQVSDVMLNWIIPQEFLAYFDVPGADKNTLTIRYAVDRIIRQICRAHNCSHICIAILFCTWSACMACNAAVNDT